jgi:hypothetical protein
MIHHKEKNGEEWYGIHEVYYNADEAPCMMTEEPCMPAGETKKELMNDLSMMTEALTKPVLEYDMEFAEYEPLDRLIKKIRRDGGIKEA